MENCVRLRRDAARTWCWHCRAVRMGMSSGTMNRGTMDYGRPIAAQYVDLFGVMLALAIPFHNTV